MKKLLCVFLTLSLCTAAFSGCASDEVQSTSEHTVSTLDDGAQVNDAFNTEVMTTLDFFWVIMITGSRSLKWALVLPIQSLYWRD